MAHEIREPRRIFATGATGYIGRRLVPALLARGHRVTALVRPGRGHVLPAGCETVTGDALDPAGWQECVAPDTLVHLVGVAHPGPSKAAQFLSVDLASLRAAVAAALHARVGHFVYVSVAHPAPVMHAYVAARMQGEALVAASGIAATVVRPWYVLGPGHRWPLVLLPAYWIARQLPATRESAERLGLVTLDQMVTALVAAIETVPQRMRILDVPAIRAAVLPALRR